MNNKNISLLFDYSELNNLFTKSFNIETFFQEIVDLIIKHMKGDICSIFLYDDNKDEIYRKTSTDMSYKKVKPVYYKLNNNFIGLSLKNYEPVINSMIFSDTETKIFKQNENENFQYKSFVAMPIFRGKIKFGVIVIKSKKINFFKNEDVLALQIISSQLAFLIESAKIFLTIPGKKISKRRGKTKTTKIIDNTHFKGDPASSGVVYGEGIVYENTINLENIENITKNYNFTLADFNTALKNTAQQLAKIQKDVEVKLSDASSLIFTAQLLMLKDSSFLNEIYKRIDNKENIPKALLKTFYKYKDIFLKIPDPLIKEKVQDIEDLMIRLLSNLIKLKTEFNGIDYDGKIIISKKIFPSDIFKMSVGNVKGIILIDNGLTAHISILARSLKIPLIVVNNDLLLNIPDKSKILVDANSGDIYYEPDIGFANELVEINLNREKTLYSDLIIKSKTLTKDGKPFKLLANINLLSDLNNIENIEIDGIGLFRTEFPFIIRKNFPTEEEQFVSYKKLFDTMHDKEVTIRTLDIGGDKVLAYYQMEKEENPFLGLRSIRFSLKHVDIFKQQIKAILRAGYQAKLKIMFPLINTIEEFLEAKKITLECLNELKKGNILCNENPKIGLMIEVPSAVSMIDSFAQEADFFSIGTNDLIQYTLAVDRSNFMVSDLYIPHHPSILKSIKLIASAANKNKIEVSICGDMANNEKYIPFLIGAGINSLSVDAIYLPKVKKIISELTIDYCNEITSKLLVLSKITDIEDVLSKIVKK